MEVGVFTVLISTLPAIVTGAVAVIVSRHQLKTKTAEIRGNSEYKARENLWRMRQKKREGIDRGVQEINNAIGQVIGGAAALHDQTERASHLRGALFMVRWLNDVVGEQLDSIRNDLCENGLDNRENLDQLESCKEVIYQDLDSLRDEDLEKFFIKYSKAMLFLSSLANEIEEKEATELFAPYLNDV